MTDSVDQDQAEQAAATISKALEDATFDELMSKPKRVHAFTIQVPDGNGGTVPRRITYQAISGKEYDALVALHPPKPRDKGTKVYNEDTFPQALVAAVSYKPRLTVDQAEALMSNPAFAKGEAETFFAQAWALCNADFTVSFSESD